ncbi:MAG: MurR/RpiR family transcriptional regulator [Cellulosilyticaceae bacterium]
MLNNDLMQRIKKSMPKLSKGQKLIGNYILEHYEKAVYLTAAKLGTIVGVSESTVVRFANEIGYDGYPKFQEALEELVKSKLTALQRLEVTTDRIDTEHVLRSVLQTDEEKIRYTLEHMDETIFDEAVEQILKAKTIYIIGVRSCAGLASFLGFYFNIVFPNVKLINTNSISEMFEIVHRIDENDVIIGISFPRYSKRILKILEFANSKRASVIAITDSNISPIAQYAKHTLIGRSEMISFVDSLVAPLSIINALIVAVSLKKRHEISSHLEHLESIWMEYEVYDNAKEAVTSTNNTINISREKTE